MTLSRSQRRARARARQLDGEGAGQTTPGQVVGEAPAAAAEPVDLDEQAPAAEAPRPATAERLTEPAAGKRTRPGDVPAPRPVVVIVPAQRWCCPDCMAVIAAPRGRRLDVRCRPCRAEVDRRPRRQPLQREVCQ